MAMKSNLKGLLYLVFSIVMIVSIVSKALPIFSKGTQRDLLEVEKIELEKEADSLQSVVELLHDEEYALRYARSHYVFTAEGQSVSIIPE